MFTLRPTLAPADVREMPDFRPGADMAPSSITGRWVQVISFSVFVMVFSFDPIRVFSPEEGGYARGDPEADDEIAHEVRDGDVGQEFLHDDLDREDDGKSHYHLDNLVPPDRFRLEDGYIPPQ